MPRDRLTTGDEPIPKKGIPILYIKLGALAVGLIIFALAVVLGFMNVNEMRTETDMGQELYRFTEDFMGYEKISASSGSITGHFDVAKLDSLTVQDIEADLDPEFAFTIEIIDVSPYSNSHSFSEQNSTHFSTGGGGDNEMTLTRPVVLVVDDEFHAARLMVTMRS